DNLRGGADPHWYPLGPLVYVGQQVAILLVFWFVAWAAAMVAHRPWREADPGKRYLWWLSAPMFLNFLLFSVKTGVGEANWPVTAYLSGLVLAAGWLVAQCQAKVAWYRRLTALGLGLTAACGVLLTVLVHHTEWLHPALERFAGVASAANPLP